MKFKVWDITNKRYLDPSEVAITGNGTLIITKSGWYSDFENVNKNNFKIEIEMPKEV